jgi:hypothetical protein
MTGTSSASDQRAWKDHIVPLACGGPDTVSNLQWQTIRDARAKDTWERKACVRQRAFGQQLHNSADFKVSHCQVVS